MLTKRTIERMRDKVLRDSPSMTLGEDALLRLIRLACAAELDLAAKAACRSTDPCPVSIALRARAAACRKAAEE